MQTWRAIWVDKHEIEVTVDTEDAHEARSQLWRALADKGVRREQVTAFFQHS